MEEKGNAGGKDEMKMPSARPDVSACHAAPEPTSSFKLHVEAQHQATHWTSRNTYHPEVPRRLCGVLARRSVHKSGPPFLFTTSMLVRASRPASTKTFD